MGNILFADGTDTNDCILKRSQFIGAVNKETLDMFQLSYCVNYLQPTVVHSMDPNCGALTLLVVNDEPQNGTKLLDEFCMYLIAHIDDY